MELQIDGKHVKDYSTRICGAGHIHLDFGTVQFVLDSEFAEYLALNIHRAALTVKTGAHLQDEHARLPKKKVRRNSKSLREWEH